MNIRLSCIILALSLSGCHTSKYFQRKIIEPVLETTNVSTSQKELDEIYSLLIYSIVYKDWQSQDVPRNKRRGYNIGALLVDSSRNPVYVGLNSINSTNNATAHGEVLAITGYINKERCFNLQNFTIYTTLEPCVMCAGMMTMTAVKRLVFGQHDVEYSKAFERLSIDTRSIGGFGPYPRQVEAEASPSIFCARLDTAYQIFLKKDNEKILAKFLTSSESKSIYHDAYMHLKSFTVQHPENSKFYQEALHFLNTFNDESVIK